MEKKKFNSLYSCCILQADLIWDENRNPYLIEINTSAGLYSLLKAHLYVIPQLVQSSLDLVISTHEHADKLNEQWQHPENLDLGRWKILYNEATNYDILDDSLKRKEDL